MNGLGYTATSVLEVETGDWQELGGSGNGVICMQPLTGDVEFLLVPDGDPVPSVEDAPYGEILLRGERLEIDIDELTVVIWRAQGNGRKPVKVACRFQTVVRPS